MGDDHERDGNIADHVLLYDGECAACSAFGTRLSRAGTVSSATYQEMAGELEGVAVDRAVNEVAMVNRATGKVTYGAETLMALAQSRHPGLAPLFRQGWFRWVAEKLYRFIAYNRRVLLPTRTTHAVQPSFHAGYRTAYIVVAWLVTATFLYHYSHLLIPLIPPTSYGREFYICGGQILWQAAFLALFRQGKYWDYLGNMMTISLAGGFALGAIQLVLSPWFRSPFFFGVLFTGVAGLMFLEHIRRTRILAISSWLTVTWVLLRVVLLGVILWFR